MFKTFLEPTNVDYQLFAFLGSSGLFLGLGSGPKTFLGHTYID